MKKIIIAFCLIFLFKISAQQTDWTYITTDNDNREYYYKANSYNTAWTKEVSKKIEYYSSNKIDSKKSVDGYQLVLYKFDCSGKKIGVGSIITYSNSGKLIKSSQTDDFLIEMENVIPESVGESLLNSFCSNSLRCRAK